MDEASVTTPCDAPKSPPSTYFNTMAPPIHPTSRAHQLERSRRRHNPSVGSPSPSCPSSSTSSQRATAPLDRATSPPTQHSQPPPPATWLGPPWRLRRPRGGGCRLLLLWDLPRPRPLALAALALALSALLLCAAGHLVWLLAVFKELPRHSAGGTVALLGGYWSGRGLGLDHTLRRC